MVRFRFPTPPPRQLRQDIDEELAFHLTAGTEDHMHRGLSEEEARARAEARLGDMARLRRALYRIDHRSARETRLMFALTDLRHDLRFSLRRIARRPLFFALLVSTLALGTGTVMTFAGAADAILLRPLPIVEPDRVMTIWRSPADNPDALDGLAPGTAMDLVEESRTFAAITAAEPWSQGFPINGVPHSIATWRVTAGFFDVFQVQPAQGRLLLAPDFDPGAPPVVVVSHVFFMTRLGGDTSTVGNPILLDGTPVTLVGVLPHDFPFTEGIHLITPTRITGSARENRRADYFSTFGRLASGVTPAMGHADLRAVVRRSDARIVGPQTRRELQMVPLLDHITGSVRTGMSLLALGAILLLITSAVNAAGLMAADTMERQRELAIRASVGAGRGRIVRQLAAEAAVIATLAGATGFGLGVAGLRVFQQLAPAELPRLAELTIDGRLGLLVAASVLVTALVLAAFPLRTLAGSSLRMAPGGSSSPWGGSGRRTRMALVGTQVALAFLLLGSGGVLVRSWVALQNEDQGYQAEGLIAIEGHVWQYFPTAEARETFGREAVEFLAARPGVSHAVLASSLPLAPGIGNDQARANRFGRDLEVTMRAVIGTPDLFVAADIPVLQGRAFGPQDRSTGELVAVLNQAAANLLFPDRSPLDQILNVSYSAAPRPRRVVGVVGDVRFGSPTEPSGPTVFLPHAQEPTGSLYLLTKYTAVGPGTIPDAIQAVRDLVPGSSVEGALDLGEVLRTAKAPRRFAMLLVASFSAIALVLTAVGLFGLLVQGVRARRQELGIRIALGARPDSLRRMVIREGLQLTSYGLVAGVTVFLMMSGVLRQVIYGVPAQDVMTIAAVTVLVLTVAAAASWWPARQATRVDPLETLRGD